MEGKCLCGAVSVTVKVNKYVEACHCGMCRRWSGGPLLVIHCGSDVQIGGNGNVSIFKSSQWAERGFCSTCGTHLFYLLKGPNQYSVPAGLFQAQDGFEFREQIFIDKKPPYYEFANDTAVLTEAQVFARFAPQ
jgi:hypothetical protein